MRKGIAVLLAAATFLGGFVLGRRFPVHHYEMWERVGIDSPATGLLFDSNTGRVCSPLGATKIGDTAITACPN
jgi:hypothetical protein